VDWQEFCAENIPTPATVTVEALAGSGSYGPVHAAAVAVTPCVVEDVRRMVRVQTQDAAGKEQLSSTTVWMPPATVCPAGSKVTYGGRTAKVLAVAKLSAHGLDLPEHLEVSLE
jgi:hypothetical protein